MKTKHETPAGIRKIQQDFKALSKRRPVQIWELNLLGYLAGEHESVLCDQNGKANFLLVEIVHGDTGQEAGFSLLWHNRGDAGYVLPHRYCYYIEDEPLQCSGKFQLR